MLVNRMGRRNVMILGFSGYLVIGLIVGCAYDKVIKVRRRLSHAPLTSH